MRSLVERIAGILTFVLLGILALGITAGFLIVGLALLAGIARR